MSIALENRVTELEAANIRLANQLEELNKRLQKIEHRKKPGPKPLVPQDNQ